MAELRFELLGPVRAWLDTEELDLGSRQQRAVLAVLLLYQGRQISMGALVDALWGESPPRAAIGTVRTYISRLRQCLGAATGGGKNDVIDTAGDGYLLRLDAAWLDLDLFLRQKAEAQEASRRGELAAAAALLRRALDLWQGAPLAGVPGLYAESQRARLTELRMAALEDRLELDIKLGQHVMAAAELPALLTGYPLRERLTELLMLALYRSGRQADALAVFGNAQRTLADDLGIDPGPGVRDMHRRILEMDDSLVESAGAPEPATRTAPAPVTRPAQLPADLAAFTGRRRELEQLGSLLAEDLRRSTVMISTIDGMAGIGKTALAVHWAHQVADQFADGQLYVDLRGFDPSGTVMRPGEALRGFLDALGVAPQQIPDSLDAQAALYRSLLNDRRMFVLLDNARDVDQVRPLLPGSPGCTALITSRNELTTLIATHGAQSISVDSLSPDEAREVLTRRLGAIRLADEPDALAEIVDLCGGLPLAAAIIAARATVRRHLPLAVIASELRDAHTRLDALSVRGATADVRAVFSWSYRQLSEPAAWVFRLLSLHGGPDISPGAAASLAGLAARDVRPLLGELSTARLITEHRAGRFIFHDLIRVYAAELNASQDDGTDRHAAAGRLLDHYLHTAYSANLQLQPHFVPPAPVPRKTGVTPERAANFSEALAWFVGERHVLKTMISRAADAGYRAHAWQLALTMQQFYQRQGHWHDWADTMMTALDAAMAAGDIAAEAHTRRGLAGAYHFLGRDDESFAELELTSELFTKLEYSTEHAFVCSNFGSVLAGQGHYDSAIEHYDKAYDLYVVMGHEKGQAASIHEIGICYSKQHKYQESISFIEKSTELYRRLDDHQGLGNNWNALGMCHHMLGDEERALECFGRAISMFHDLGSRAAEAEALTNFGDSSLSAGHAEAALGAWRAALAILEGLRLPSAGLVRGKLRAVLGS